MTSKEAMEKAAERYPAHYEIVHMNADTPRLSGAEYLVHGFKAGWLQCEQYYKDLAPEFDHSAAYAKEDQLRREGNNARLPHAICEWQFDQLKAWAGSVKSENERLRELLETATCECTIAERVSGHRVACHMPEIQEALKPKEVSGE